MGRSFSKFNIGLNYLTNVHNIIRVKLLDSEENTMAFVREISNKKYIDEVRVFEVWVGLKPEILLVYPKGPDVLGESIEPAHTLAFTCYPSSVGSVYRPSDKAIEALKKYISRKGLFLNIGDTSWVKDSLEDVRAELKYTGVFLSFIDCFKAFLSTLSFANFRFCTSFFRKEISYIHLV